MHGSENEFREQHPFQLAGTITSAQTALAVTGRDEVTVDAIAATKTVIIEVPFGCPALEFRLRFLLSQLPWLPRRFMLM